MNKYKYTQQGFDDLIKQRDILLLRLSKNCIDMAKSRSIETGSESYENAELQTLIIEQNVITSQLRSINNKIFHATIVKGTNNVNTVNVGDTVKLGIKYSETDYEEIVITITGGTPNIDENIFSLQSPIVEAIIDKEVSTTQETLLGNETIKIAILEKVDLNLELIR